MAIQKIDLSFPTHEFLESGYKGIGYYFWDEPNTHCYGPYSNEHIAQAAEKEYFNKLNKSGINHPNHYNSHPSGIECITIAEHYNFNLGNALKYIWRAGLKSPNAIEDLKKAAWYLDREIKRLEK